MHLSNLIQESDEVYFDHNFLILLDSHLTHLKTSGNITVLPITKHQNYKYEGDFFGLLDDLNIEKKFHHVVSRVNGYSSSNDFKGDKDFILVPDLQEVELLRSVYTTRNIF